MAILEIIAIMAIIEAKMVTRYNQGTKYSLTAFLNCNILRKSYLCYKEVCSFRRDKRGDQTAEEFDDSDEEPIQFQVFG